MKCRRCAIASYFCQHGKVLLEGDPRTLPEQYGAASLEDLFIRLAREPLAEGGHP